MFPFAPIFLQSTVNKGGVSDRGLAIYINNYLKAKEELWKLKYFTIQKSHLPKIM
jgi:hypothetical protein